jgi:ubiquinone/menaquinone biosynthesis C-methylase UbiE
MASDLTSFKEKQKYFDTEAQASSPVRFTGNEYHDYFRRIPFLYLRRLLIKNKIDLTGRYLHVASCGAGIDIYYLKAFIDLDSEVYASDYSKEAVKVTLEVFPGLDGGVEDNEKLSFKDDHFDYSFIAASLHHLPRPVLGLYELLRVSKHGVIVIEPNDCWLTRLATKLGLAQEIEETGNYVYRLSKREVHKIASSLFCDYYVVRCFATHRIATTQAQFLFLKLTNKLCNFLIPSLGNYIVFVMQKRCTNGG